MTNDRIFGAYAYADAERPLTEFALSFVPLDCLAEWRRCGDIADYAARFLAYDYEDREAAVGVLSTVVNEIVENAVKFSDDRHTPARLRVRQYADSVRIDATNRSAAGRGDTFAAALVEVLDGNPEALFAARVATPLDAGGPGLGLIMLRRDYGAQLGVRLSFDGELVEVEIQVRIPSREVEQQ